LGHLTDQLAGMTQQSGVALLAKTFTTAREPAERDLVRAPSPTSQAAAARALQSFLPEQDPNAIQVEIWTTRNSTVLVLPNGSSPMPSDLSAEFAKCNSDPFRVFGAFREINGTIAYPTVAAITDEREQPIGYLVRWRKIMGNSDTRNQLTELIGSGATAYFGNLQGNLWTDMERVVKEAPGGFPASVSEYKRDGNPVLALGRPIAGTPWFIVIEFSRQAITAPATRFFRRAIIIDLVLLFIGVAFAFAMSRNIIRPLHSLTDAASAIASGNFSRKVKVSTHDELGALGLAFNTMVSQVRNSQKQLELKVQERTQELEEANKQLELLSQTHELKRSQAEKERTEAVDALRNTEQQLQQAQKLEAVGRLAGGISHDFNNILTAILGYSDLTLQRLLDGDPLKRNLLEIRNASVRAAALTRQLLAFSRKQVLQPITLDLNSVVQDLERMLARMIGEDIELTTSLNHELGNVRADPGQMEQVIMNLVVNARDAMPDGGKLMIETDNVELDESYAQRHLSVSPGPYIMLAVSDTGTGMDSDTLEHMFEPFFTTKEAGKGTGLGLSTVYGIVKQSGGNIFVYSEMGRGTTFKIYLPQVDKPAEKYTTGGLPREIPRGTETILLVEDSDVVRALAQEVLEASGFQVFEAADPESAIAICENHNGAINLLLTDVVMPGMSGSEMSVRLLKLCPRMRVLFMSGYTADAIVNQGVLDGGLNFIQKPFTPDALVLKVREVLDLTVES
jgi:signal transduction histidine kinase